MTTPHLSQQIGHKLAKLIATVHAIKRQQPPKQQPRFRNGMAALAEWEARQVLTHNNQAQ